MNTRLSLIVDDEPGIRTFLKTILQRNGFQSLEADNALDARRTIQRLGSQIDLVLSDIEMGGEMDGLDLAHWVKDSFPATLVILMSGGASEAPAEFPFLHKPFRMEDILKVVSSTTPTPEFRLPRVS